MGRPKFVIVQFRHTLKMASTLSRVCLRGSSLLKNTQAINSTTRTISVSASRSKEERLCPEGIPHATGIEKWEMMAAQAGNDNPFDTYVIKPDAGTGIFQKSQFSFLHRRKVEWSGVVASLTMTKLYGST